MWESCPIISNHATSSRSLTYYNEWAVHKWRHTHIKICRLPQSSTNELYAYEIVYEQKLVEEAKPKLVKTIFFVLTKIVIKTISSSTMKRLKIEIRIVI